MTALVDIGYNWLVAPVIAMLPSPAAQSVFSRMPKEVEPLDGLEAAIKHTWLSGAYQGGSVFGISSALGYLIGGNEGLPIGVILGELGVIDGALRMIVGLGVNYGKGEREPKAAGFLEGYVRFGQAIIGVYRNEKQ